MIIGKSLTALGGGGLKPEITVTAKAGTLLNLHYKDSSIILKSYQLGESETQHTFVVSVSETSYVVEDVTNGKSVEVLVDAVAQYSVEIEYVLWLYKDGDECTDVTGGWTGLGVTGSSGYLTKNASSFTLVYSSGTNSYDAVTENTVNISDYSKLYIDWVFNPAKKGNARIGVSSSAPSGDVGLSKYSMIYATYTGVTELDISDVSNQYYAVVTVYNESVTVNKIWLE